MPRKLATTYTKTPAVMPCMGDSHTMRHSNGVQAYDNYPTVLAALLETASGRPVAEYNVGIAGDTSRAASGGSWTTSVGMKERIASITGREFTSTPIGVLYVSTNNWSAVTAGATLTGYAGTAADVDEDVTLPDVISLATSMLEFGVTNLVVVGYHLRNWSTGGDVTAGTINIEPSLVGANPGTFGHGSRWAAYKAVQTLAATYPGRVAFCDLYAAFKARLEADAPASIGVDSYLHVETGDTHLNARGLQWVADAIQGTIEAQSGWIAAVTDA